MAMVVCASPRVQGGQAPSTTPGPPPSKPIFSRSILLGAHRGGAALWPENTLPAFQEAVKRWPDVLLETDARLTADGHVVLLHDDTVDRTTDGTGPVVAMNLADLKKLDAGYRFTPDGGKTFPYRGRGVKVPTLAEVLAALPGARFEIELKPCAGVAEATVKVIQTAGAEDRVLLASFDPRLALRARKLARRIAACYEVLGGLRMLDELRRGDWAAYQPTADVLSLPAGMLRSLHLTPGELRAIQAKGIRIQVHTINRRPQMQDMLDLGVDSILSDRPNLLAEVIAERREPR